MINWSATLNSIRKQEKRCKSVLIIHRDEVVSLKQGFLDLWEQHGEERYLGTREIIRTEEGNERGEYLWRSYNDIKNDAIALSRYFAEEELYSKTFLEKEESGSKQDRDFQFIGIFAKNREEWVVTDLACIFNNITSVPFYDTLGVNSVEFIINQAQLKCIWWTSDKIKLLTKLKKSNKIDSLETLILYDEWDHEKAIKCPFNLVSYFDAIDEGKKLENKLEDPNINSILCLCYTSGTTGLPKGAMITHMNIICLVKSLKGTGMNIEPTDVHISYLPLAHTFERVLVSSSYLKRFSVGFYSGNILKLKEDLQKLRPTLFASVPRVYNKLYVGITQRLNQAGCCKRGLTQRAIRSKLARYHIDGTVTHSLWDNLIFGVFRAGLGGNVRYMLTASAPIKPEILDFLKVCFCAQILEGYGQTETAAATLTRAEDKDTGTVGGPLECCEIKLQDVKELNYLTTDLPNPRGEVLIRGNNLWEGYFRNSEKNKETFDDEGWARTGDIGELLPNGALKIIDRKKHIFKLSQGEYIAPEKLENIFSQSPFFKKYLYIWRFSARLYCCNCSFRWRWGTSMGK